MVKKFYFIITGSMILSVSARGIGEAEEKAQAYLEENSPLREWSIDAEPADTYVDVADIEF